MMTPVPATISLCIWCHDIYLENLTCPGNTLLA